mmetsp:Transcript_3053/g.11065  ORF Transcript_3053/g.11065 Transcript_3053/m.11065 type:complete len:228 (+) Transcript_3053:4146-4829(+)
MTTMRRWVKMTTTRVPIRCSLRAKTAIRRAIRRAIQRTRRRKMRMTRRKRTMRKRVMRMTKRWQERATTRKARIWRRMRTRRSPNARRRARRARAELRLRGISAATLPLGSIGTPRLRREETTATGRARLARATRTQRLQSGPRSARRRLARRGYKLANVQSCSPRGTRTRQPTRLHSSASCSSSRTAHSCGSSTWRFISRRTMQRRRGKWRSALSRRSATARRRSA